METISSYRTWRKTGLFDEDGVIVGSDANHEWLLVWWWENYSRFNSLPVAFVDFGMSPESRKWCQERGLIVDLIVENDFVATREQMNPAPQQFWRMNRVLGFGIIGRHGSRCLAHVCNLPSENRSGSI